MKTLYLIRHAQSSPSRALPDPEWPLSQRGHAQARSLVDVLFSLGIEEVHTSPYRRCRDTIAPFVSASGLPVHTHVDLRERKVAAELIANFREVWQRSWSDFSFALPDCETSDEAQHRVCAAVTRICESTSATTVAVNSHGNALALLINRTDARFGLERASAVRNPDLFRMIYRAGTLRWDETWRAPELDAFASHHDETRFPELE